jgi:hypothetical protein
MFSFNASIDIIWLIMPLILVIGSIHLFSIFQKWETAIRICTTLILLFIPIYFNSRALLLGNLLSICYFQKMEVNRRKYLVWLGITLIGIVLIFWKFTSTISRIHIWHISLNLLQKNWIKGLGSTPFNVAFNHEQAEWFARQSSLNTQVGLLANDGYYAFNDWLQIAIEWGIWGISISTIFLTWFICLVNEFRNNTLSFWPKYFIGALIPIITLSMVSYPLHKEPILALALILAWLLFCNLHLPAFFTKPNSTLTSFIRIIGLSMIVFVFGYRFWVQHSFEKIYNASVYEWKIGNRAEGLKIIDQIPDNILVSTHPFAVTKAYWFWQMDSVPKAIHLLESHHSFHCNQRNHTLLGRWYNETGDFAFAERHMLLSLHITPHLLESRFDLMKLYTKCGKKQKASYWARELIKFPIKVKNERADYLKNEAMKFLATGKQAL